PSARRVAAAAREPSTPIGARSGSNASERSPEALFEHGLAYEERFGVTGRRAALDAAQPGQREHGVGAEPVLRALRRECVEDVRRLALAVLARHGNEEIRLSQVAVVLRNLVLQHELRAEVIPGEFADESMVLMPVVPGVRQHEI